MTRYDDVLGDLRAAYDGAAAERDARPKSPWKLAERDAFLARLPAGCRLLEIGAGPGHDSVAFRDRGLRVLATDPSPQMVRRCRAKGLDALVADVLHLDLPPASFDAVWALNCLLHVPDADLPAALAAIRAVLRPGGLFFLGVYGSADEPFEGVMERDHHVPARFFAFRTDDQLRRFARAAFDIVDFHVVGEGGDRFQSLTLRRPSTVDG